MRGQREALTRRCQIRRDRARLVRVRTICYEPAMARRARGFTSILLIVLVALEATPEAPRVAAAVPMGGCVISASIKPVTLIALPSERPTSTALPDAGERLPLPPFTLAAVDTTVSDLASPRGARRVPSVHGERVGWLQSRQRRARAPDDSDPF